MRTDHVEVEGEPCPFVFFITKEGKSFKGRQFQKVVVLVPKKITKGEKLLGKISKAIRKQARKGVGPVLFSGI